MWILKAIFLLLAVVYGLQITIKVIYKVDIYPKQVWLFAIGIVGFVFLQFDLI